MGPRVELIAGALEVPRVSSLYPMASAGTEEWGCTYQTPGGCCRRQSWRAQQRKSGRGGDQAGRSLNAKDRRYNQPCWEVRRRFPDWRMRSPSDEGRDNTTLLERGPLGSGGTSNVQGPHAEAGSLSRQMVVSKAPANPWWAAGMPGIRLKRGNIWWKAGHRTARCLSLKPYWGKPTVRNFREGGWKRERWSD